MTTKLTLSVEKATIEKAKRYAKRQNKSLSQLIETYLEYLTNEKDIGSEIDVEVLKLSDDIPVEELPDLDEARYQYLKGKYLNA